MKLSKLGDGDGREVKGDVTGVLAGLRRTGTGH